MPCSRGPSTNPCLLCTMYYVEQDSHSPCPCTVPYCACVQYEGQLEPRYRSSVKRKQTGMIGKLLAVVDPPALPRPSGTALALSNTPNRRCNIKAKENTRDTPPLQPCLLAVFSASGNCTHPKPDLATFLPFACPAGFMPEDPGQSWCLAFHGCPFPLVIKIRPPLC